MKHKTKNITNVKRTLNRSDFNFEFSDKDILKIKEGKDFIVILLILFADKTTLKEEKRTALKELEQMLNPDILPGFAKAKYKCPDIVKVKTHVIHLIYFLGIYWSSRTNFHNQYNR